MSFMSNIDIFEKQIKARSQTPIEVRLRHGEVEWFIAYDNARYLLLIYDKLGKAYAADYILSGEPADVPVHGIVRVQSEDSIVTTIDNRTTYLVRYGRFDLVI